MKRLIAGIVIATMLVSNAVANCNQVVRARVTEVRQQYSWGERNQCYNCGTKTVPSVVYKLQLQAGNNVYYINVRERKRVGEYINLEISDCHRYDRSYTSPRDRTRFDSYP